MQQRLVVAGLELVGANQEAVRFRLELGRDMAGRKAVERGLADLRPTVLVLAREGDQRLDPALAFLQIVADGVEILDRPLDAVGDHHRPRLSADLALGEHLLVEVIHHDFGLEADRMVVPLHEPAQLLLRLLHVELGVVLHRLGQLVVTLHRRVACEHVQDEALLDRLLHGVSVKGVVLYGAVGLWVGRTEDLQRLVFGCRGEGEIAGVWQQLA